ncbi:MAG: septum formation protein Maf [Chthoniobacterales bacterium]|nr:septum formation protein Maf [Chthoniobacterales bacterium]
MPALVLASGSPRRRELLSAAGVDFEVFAPDAEESASCALTVRELTAFNATRKALAVARRRPEAVVLGADTLVALEGEVIGKPPDLDHARATLRRLSGREHQVCTAVFICAAAGKKSTSFDVVTDVLFRELSDDDISAYFGKINPLDKAGAYAAQGHGSTIIREVRGSFTNVVGLPIDETLRVLRAFGIVPSPR